MIKLNMKINSTDTDMIELFAVLKNKTTLLWAVVHRDVLDDCEDGYDGTSCYERIKNGETLTFELVEKRK